MKSITPRRLLLLALLAPLFTLTILADDPVEVNGIYYNLVPKGKIATVTQNPNGYSGSIVIPPSFTISSGTVYSVVGIEEFAFSGSSLTSVTIPSTVTSIGQYAFSSCYMTSVTIPNSVTSIGDDAFFHCSSLTSVNIPSSVSSIPNHCFHGCSSLTSVNILESVTYIGDDAFRGCTSLTSVTIPNSVTSIPDCCFQDCYSLTSVTIPESVTNIGQGAFSSCSSLTSITIPNSITSIGYYAFGNCSSLTSIVLPNVRSIDEKAFYGCTQLRSVTMEREGNVGIGNKAFANCSNLEEFNINSYVKYEWTETEWNPWSEEYEEVTKYREEIAKVESDAFENSFVEYATLHVPEAAIGLYSANDTWSQFGTITSLGSASTYYKLFVDVNAKGQVVYGEGEFAKTITGASQTFDVKEQEDIVLTLTAYEGYKLGAVTVNGVDKTAAVTSEGVLTITDVNGNQTVSVEFVMDGNSVAVTIGELGAATFCCEEALDFSGTEEVKAYIVSAFHPATGKVTLTRITDVPAGTGIVLLGNAGTYDIPIGAGETYVVNMLVGVTADKVLNKTEGANSNFILANGENGVGFYAVKDGSTLAAGKAYLSLPTAVLPSSAQSISFRFDDATNIASPQPSPEGKGDWYDLSGRRVNGAPTAPGLYIKDGRKVIVK